MDPYTSLNNSIIFITLPDIASDPACSSRRWHTPSPTPVLDTQGGLCLVTSERIPIMADLKLYCATRYCDSMQLSLCLSA
eukprot:scaffold226890_cov41-Prasinocladus_malaysianus.AAC.2